MIASRAFFWRTVLPELGEFFLTTSVATHGNFRRLLRHGFCGGPFAACPLQTRCILFENCTDGHRFRQSIVEYGGVSNFHVLSERVQNVIGTMEWSPTLAPVFEFWRC